MIDNRSMPQDVLIPVLGYPSVTEAVGWLTGAFGFTLRWRIGTHRAQLGVGATAAIAVTEDGPARPSGADHVVVRVPDAAAHRDRAVRYGASCSELEDFPYGERQYTAIDLAGRRWVFSQSLRDVAPQDWGATTANHEEGAG
jgi:uncharacterized glyoxalase superfamily protein PhnB